VSPEEWMRQFCRHRVQRVQRLTNHFDFEELFESQNLAVNQLGELLRCENLVVQTHRFQEIPGLL
jgi:hypothetical protein